jgi:hypothetical protein
MPRERPSSNRDEDHHHYRSHHRYSHRDWQRNGWSLGVNLSRGGSGLNFYFGPMIDDSYYPCYYPRAVYYPRVWVVNECYAYWYGCPLYSDGCPVHGYHHREGYCEWYYNEYGGMDFRYYPQMPEWHNPDVND